jgi:glycosyltransferase involved in cell wall biosynthesis
VEEFEAEHVKQERVVMLGQKDYATELPRYLKAADVAVLPNTAREEISRICTSPLKLFAYMASGAPLVASDVPALREVISERSAVFVAPDDPAALAGGIRALAEDPARAAALAAVAKEDARQYTWEKRAERILSFIA